MTVRSRRALLLAGSVAGLVATLVLAACGGSSDTARAPVPTVEALPIGPGPDPGRLVPETTILFPHAIAAVNQQLDSVGDDVCKLVQALRSFSLAKPTTPEEVQTVLMAEQRIFETFAAFNPSAADLFASVTANREPDAAANGHSPEWYASLDLHYGNVEGLEAALAPITARATTECEPTG